MELIALLSNAWGFVAAGATPPPELLKLILSKVLGYAILLGACIVKLPQVLAVHRSKSAEGLNTVSFELETFGLLVGLSYGYVLGLPFSTYGEVVFLFFQNVLLLGMIYTYAKKPVWRGMGLSVFLTTVMAYVFSGQASRALVQTAYDANTALFLVSRLPQIYQNLTTKSTGQLSAVTQGLQFAGGLARVFTSMQEKTGAAMLRGFILGAALNGIIFLQIMLYGNAKARAEKAKSKKED